LAAAIFSSALADTVNTTVNDTDRHSTLLFLLEDEDVFPFLADRRGRQRSTIRKHAARELRASYLFKGETIRGLPESFSEPRRRIRQTRAAPRPQPYF
jgi:hypothetical protein